MTKSSQNSYVNVRKRNLELDVHDCVYLKISPMKGLMRVFKKANLIPRYAGPYTIFKGTCKVTYELDF